MTETNDVYIVPWTEEITASELKNSHIGKTIKIYSGKGNLLHESTLLNYEHKENVPVADGSWAGKKMRLTYVVLAGKVMPIGCYPHWKVEIAQ